MEWIAIPCFSNNWRFELAAGGAFNLIWQVVVWRRDALL